MCLTEGLYVRSVLTAGTLPESKGVNHDDVGSANDGITSSISELVPRVGGSDLDALRQAALDGADLVLQLGAGEVAAVKGLRTDGYGVDRIGVLLGNVGNGLEVLLEGLLDIGPAVPCVSKLGSESSLVGT